MENVRHHKNIELIHTEERLKKVAAKSTFKKCTIFNDDLVAAELFKSKVNFVKPIYCGMSILGNIYFIISFIYFFVISVGYL